MITTTLCSGCGKPTSRHHYSGTPSARITKYVEVCKDRGDTIETLESDALFPPEAIDWCESAMRDERCPTANEVLP